MDEFFDEEGAFAHGLFAEGPEPLGNLAEAGGEFLFVAAFDEGEVLLERLEVVLEQGEAFGGGEDDLGVKGRVLGEETAHHGELKAIDGAGKFEGAGDGDAARMEELAEGKGGEVAQGLDDAHDVIMLGGGGLNENVAPAGKLVEQPLALGSVPPGADHDDLLVHGDSSRAEKWVESDDRPGVVLEHSFKGLALEASDIGQDTRGGEMGGDLSRHGAGGGDGDAEQAQVNAICQGARVGPVVAVEEADVVVGLAEPGGEESAHLAVAANDKDLGTRPDAAAAEGVQLANAGMAQHGAEEVFDVVGVEPGLGGLGASGGDEVLLAGGVVGGEIMALLDLGDLLDDLAAAGEQLHELLIDGIDLSTESLETGPGGSGLRGRAGLRVL